MQYFSDRLLDWYNQSRRHLPWREDPQPYYILVSEFMLQQTRMDTVLPYFDRFITALPTLDALATASEETLLKLWEGLGYYRRVRNLARTARIIQEEHNGIIPSDPTVLRSLPGIGDYIAGAIASTAYQVRVSAIDGNVIRILTRLTCNSSDVTKAVTRKQLQGDLLERLPADRVGDFNQALMELGALICLPNGEPLCGACPVSADCCAYQRGRVLDFPVKPKKSTVPTEKKTVLVVRSQDHFAVEQFEPGLLEGLWRFPMLEGHVELSDVTDRYPGAIVSPLPASRHMFSHKIWDMIGYLVRLPESEVGWVDRSKLASLTFPTALKVYRRFIDES